LLIVCLVGKPAATNPVPSNHDVPDSVSVVLQRRGMSHRPRHHSYWTAGLSGARHVEKQAERLPQICR